MDEPKFLCDDMFQGLARWLRAAGYDAVVHLGLPDKDLIRLAQQEDRMLISSDRHFEERRIVRDGRLRFLFVPHGLSNVEALGYVMAKLGLELREIRCMSCGGELESIAKEEVREVVPAKAYENYEDFYRCKRCGKVLWRGTHWDRICRTLDEAVSKAEEFQAEEKGGSDGRA